MQRWQDRRIFGVMLITGFALYGGWVLFMARALHFWQISVVLGIFCAICFAAKAQIRLGISIRSDVLVVKNAYCVYKIPWRKIRRVDYGAKNGLRLITDDGQVIVVDAFNDWPSFGRRARIAQQLEDARRMYAKIPEIGDVVEVPSRGLLEFILAIPVVVMFVSLIVEGTLHLFG
ncbi:hypothetical protein [Streptomyces spiralis]|uniref:hypothetical protein n=1 Tax=Streptomyces spiralis TaxID=66376 RepID=UPI00368F208B